jgi:S-adenosylmethionine synthetase
MEITDKNTFFFASESVGEGHPDKICDQVSDGILDAVFEVDPDAYVALESAAKTKMVSDSRLISYSFVSLEKSLTRARKLITSKLQGTSSRTLVTMMMPRVLITNQ